MITHQADRRLKQVLQSLSFFDEVLIVDSNSTDQTVPIALAFGAKVVQRPFTDFSTQKQFSVDQARHDWVLVVDSDEVVSERLATEMRALNFEQLDAEDVGGFKVRRELFFLGQRILHAGGVDFPVRFFNRKKGRFDGAVVHEKITLGGKSRTLKAPLEHYSYDTLEEYFLKFNRYTTLAAERLIQQNRQVSSLKIAFSFPVTFVRLYLLKAGFLDGLAGFLWCFLSAVSPVVKYAKVKLGNCPLTVLTFK